nr:vegetative cell wall protein gp1-like [Aegilops tauschii subsp. strangulata]
MEAPVGSGDAPGDPAAPPPPQPPSPASPTACLPVPPSPAPPSTPPAGTARVIWADLADADDVAAGRPVACRDRGWEFGRPRGRSAPPPAVGRAVADGVERCPLGVSGSPPESPRRWLGCRWPRRPRRRALVLEAHYAGVVLLRSGQLVAGALIGALGRSLQAISVSPVHLLLWRRRFPVPCWPACPGLAAPPLSCPGGGHRGGARGNPCAPPGCPGPVVPGRAGPGPPRSPLRWAHPRAFGRWAAGWGAGRWPLRGPASWPGFAPFGLASPFGGNWPGSALHLAPDRVSSLLPSHASSAPPRRAPAAPLADSSGHLAPPLPRRPCPGIGAMMRPAPSAPRKTAGIRLAPPLTASGGRRTSGTSSPPARPGAPPLETPATPTDPPPASPVGP